VALAVVMLVGYVGFSTDVMRNFLAVRKLQFASDAAALYGYSFYSSALNNTGTLNAQSVQTAIVNAGTSSDTAWNTAPSGPADLFNGPWNTGVTFAAGDVSFVPNPNDATEQFLQVTARRTGADALNQYFMPCLYTFNAWAGAPVPPSLYQASPYRITEVVGQPASRIGPGAPIATGSSNTIIAGMTGYASCPIALSNTDFRSAAQGGGTYTLDFSKTSGPASGANTIRACFVNVAPGGSALNYYASSQDANTAQITSLLKYFTLNASSTAPAAVERGAGLIAFDPTGKNFQLQQVQIVNVLQQIVAQANPYLILPVVENTSAQNTPSYTAANTVRGFARVKLLAAAVKNGLVSCTIQISELGSACIKNASYVEGFATIPLIDGHLLPAPVTPFTPRLYNVTTNVLSNRLAGIALAPALSPRNVAPPVIAPQFN
jgi:hypothetical protein